MTGSALQQGLYRTGIATVLSVVSGCGGGDDAVGFKGDIQSDNVIAVTATAYFASVAPLALGDVGERPMVPVQSVAVAGTRASRPVSLVEFAREQIIALARQDGQYPAPVLTGLRTTNIPYDNCIGSSGSGSIEWVDEDPEGEFSDDDTFDFTFNDCAVNTIFDTDIVYEQGGFTMTGFTLDGDPENDPDAGWEMGATFTFDNLRVAKSRLGANSTVSVYSEGGFDFTSTSDLGEVENITIDGSGDTLAFTVDGVSNTLSEFSASNSIQREEALVYELTVNATLDSGEYGVLTIETLDAFTGTRHFDPVDGTLKITAEDGSNVEMEVVGAADIRLRIDANGDGTVERTTGADWSLLEENL